MSYAHSRNENGDRHDLVAHLQAVAEETARFAERLGARELGYYLGLWHDLGKFDPAFQRYLLASEAGTWRGRAGPDHKAAGAQVALEVLEPLALPLQGHHGGLTSLSELKAWLDAHQATTRDALQTAQAALLNLRPTSTFFVPDHVQRDPLAAELFLRLLFSALVDADYLDTESHFNPESSASRGYALDLGDLWQRFLANQALLSGHKDDVVNRTRHAIYQACLAAAQGPPGLYRLTVPTGGGKTRSALAFALQHALEHGMERIIVAVPYLSITEQTVRNYREILERDGIPVVLEHHSGAANNDDDERANWMRLGAENWDAPVIVTTTVQLFDSLFANRPQASRKVHRLANAVIVLDEAQSLPPRCLAPILDVLQRLPAYNTTVVLSTATQPAFEAIPGFQALEAREIVPQPEVHFGALERVRYDWRLDGPTDSDDVVAEMLSEEQAMVIVNTRRDAQELYAGLAACDPSALHLSAAMCGLHKRRVLEEVGRRLKGGKRCRLVSTQVVEAGVDLDFPLVLRALGPLDAIIQAAGRCNREGKLERGRVVVFDPAEGRLPPGVYLMAAGLARAALGAGIDPNSPQAAAPYYRRLFETMDADADEIQPCRRRLDYAETARRFHLIDDASESVIVSYGTQDERRALERTIDALVERRGNPRDHWRALQPYTVSLPRSQVERALRAGLAAEVAPGLIIWSGAYDRRMGLSMEPAGGEAWVY